MEIGLFQLENLLHSRVEFQILDIRKDLQPVPAALEPILARGFRLSVENVELTLSEKKTPLTAPIILLCENGKSSARLAERLEAKGYNNVFVVEGGVAGLLSEL